MNEDLRFLAEQSFGYGRWDATYWFIGLEERMTPNEADNYANCVRAFRKLNKDGLCDSFEFHSEIGQLEFLGSQGRPQRTWGRLLWILKGLHGLHEEEDLLEYQRNRLGRSDGETCLAELDGLPIDSSGNPVSVYRVEVREELESIRPRRIRKMRDMIEEHNPGFVVMYGFSQQKYWEQIVGVPLQREVPRKLGSTTFLLAPHPSRPSRPDIYWKTLGSKLYSKSFQL